VSGWMENAIPPGMSFEDLTSAFKMDPKSLEFHGFDYFDTKRPDLPFAERQRILKDKTPTVVDTILVPRQQGVRCSKYHKQVC
jgi:hypothetical protein